MKKLNDQEIIRRSKLKELQKKNLDPYLINVEKCTSIKEIIFQNKNFSVDDKIEEIECCGRVLLIRQTFFDIYESHNKIQAYINIKNSSLDLFEYFKKYLDIGDYVYVSGSLFLTKKNELTIKVKNLKIISKCLKPLPEKHLGIKDPDLIVSERVANLITNKKVFEKFILKSKIIFEIRSFLNSLSYLEVDTPILQKITGGAAAKPFKTYYNSLNQDFYLRIAPELSLKKLITSGYTKVYEIGKLFRNEGIDSTHNPEFTSIEIYTMYFDMWQTINLTEQIFKNIANKFNLWEINWNDHQINLKPKFQIVSLTDLLFQKINVDFYNTKIDLLSAIKIAEKYNIHLLSHEKKVGHIIHKLFEKLIEKTLINPVFVYGYHKDVSPLAKEDLKNTDFTMRFELYIGGKEMANGFSELNNPIDQLQRFEAQQEEKNNGNVEISNVDYNYISDIEYGLPPTGGLGIGIDRLIMLFTSSKTIKETIFFPHIRK